MKDISEVKRVSVPAVLQSKFSSQKITAITAYDYLMAKLVDRAGVDLILVGDSLGTVVQGHPNTLPVTLDEVIYHCRCVSRAVERALIVGDLPFMSYQSSPEAAIESSGRLIKEGGVSAVKLEGGLNVESMIRAIVDIDIPVMGHVGLTPQSYHRMGGHRIQGKKHAEDHGLEPGTRERIIEDARAVQEAGAFALVIEGVPEDLAEEITALLSIPTIGIGAGPECNGQILVCTDLLGMDPDFCPSFVKKYENLSSRITLAVSNYVEEVRESKFPAAKDRPVSQKIVH